MSSPLLLGIDFGTSYLKVGLFGSAGTLKGIGRVAVARQTSATGHCELAISDFWKLLRTALADALAQAGADAKNIAALSYSSQANTFLLLDQNDAPLTPLILWTDTRAPSLDPRLLELSQTPAFARATGLSSLSTTHAAAKLRWIQDNNPAIWMRTRRVMTLSDYFTFAMTGEHAGDASTAALLGMYDLGAKTWWPPALGAAGLDPRMMSTPLAPGSACAQTTTRAADLLGIPAGAKFAVGGLDHHLAAIGSGLGRLADASISTGTVLAAIAIVPEVTPSPGCIHGPHTGENDYYRLAFDPAGAGELEDYHRQHAPALTIKQLFALAGDASAGDTTAAGSLDANALAADALAADKKNARHGPAVREILERTARVHRRLVATVANGRQITCVVATGGGSRSALWLQIKADILGIPVVSPASPERACLGAAMFAAVAAGFHSTLETCADVMVREDRVYLPTPPTY